MDNREYIQELFRVVPTDSILVIDKRGHLRRIHCPFPVKVLNYISDLEPGMALIVESVKMTLELYEVFMIEGKAYYWFHFRIIED